MFQGFTPETIDFLWGIRFNNEKSWFELHKQDYLNTLYRPMQALAADIQADLNERKGCGGLNVKVSRIYRDARRLHGRGPYKDHLWLSLFRWEDGNDGSRPVFWFELTPDDWSAGMGFWCAQPAMMERHRARIDQAPQALLTLDRRLRRQKTFALEGPEYARKKVSACPELERWYNKKSLTVGRRETLGEELYSPDLARTLSDGFAFLMPYYDYFSTLWADGEP